MKSARATDSEMETDNDRESVDSRKEEAAGGQEASPPTPRPGEGSRTTGMRLFVGGIAGTSTYESLTSYFEAFGPVKSMELMRDRKTGTSRGFAFVTMLNRKDAVAVIEADHIIEDKSVDVKLAVPKTYSGAHPCEVRKIYVGNIGQEATVEELADPFRAFGSVKEARIILDRDTAASRGFGFVTFDEPAAVESLMEKNPPVHVKGNLCEYRRAQPKQDTQVPSSENRHSKPSYSPKGAGSWDGTPAFFAPYPGSPAVYPIGGSRGMHANTEMIPVVYGYMPYGADGSHMPGQMASHVSAVGYQHQSTVVTDPHSPPPMETMPPSVPVQATHGDYVMGPHANPAYHSSHQAYQAYQPYAMPMHMQAQYQQHMQHQAQPPHQQQAYNGAALHPPMEQFPVRQAREIPMQAHQPGAAHAHVHMHAAPQVQMQVHKMREVEERYIAATAASGSGDNRFAVREKNEVE